MKSVIVFESMFGNNELVACAIADGLRKYGTVAVVNVATDTIELDTSEKTRANRERSIR